MFPGGTQHIFGAFHWRTVLRHLANCLHLDQEAPIGFYRVSVVGFTLHRAVLLHGHSMDGFRWLPNLRLDTFALLVIWFPFAPLAPVLRPVDTGGEHFSD